MAHSSLTSPYTGRLKITIEALDDPDNVNSLNQSFTFHNALPSEGYRIGMYHHTIPILGGPEYRNMVVDARYTGSTLVISSVAPMVDVALKAVNRSQERVGFGR